MKPRIGIIGGSGLGQAILAEARGEPASVDTPFGPPAAPPILMDWEGVPVAFLARHGIGHVFNPSSVPYRANIYALKALGCKWILASGAVGSLQENIHPQDLVIPDQLIDKTTQRPPTFFDRDAGAVAHVEFADPFCPDLRRILLDAADSLNLAGSSVHTQGTYVCMEGPAFSTRAESLLHRAWGAHLIGMTASPEAKLAREAEISYALVALVTDYDCWKPHDPAQTKQALLAEIISHLHAATANALTLIRRAVPDVWAAREARFATHNALELAIWSDKSQIPPDKRERLKLLWAKYLQ